MLCFSSPTKKKCACLSLVGQQGRCFWWVGWRTSASFQVLRLCLHPGLLQDLLSCMRGLVAFLQVPRKQQDVSLTACKRSHLDRRQLHCCVSALVCVQSLVPRGMCDAAAAAAQDGLASSADAQLLHLARLRFGGRRSQLWLWLLWLCLLVMPFRPSLYL